jgi:hypothetical protein
LPYTCIYILMFRAERRAAICELAASCEVQSLCAVRGMPSDGDVYFFTSSIYARPSVPHCPCMYTENTLIILNIYQVRNLSLE